MKIIQDKFYNLFHIYTDISLKTNNYHSSSGVYILEPNLKCLIPFLFSSNLETKLMTHFVALYIHSDLSDGNISILADSKSSLYIISTNKPSLFCYVKKIHELLYNIRKIRFQWILSCYNITPNVANKLARIASSLESKPEKINMMTTGINRSRRTFRKLCSGNFL